MPMNVASSSLRMKQVKRKEDGKTFLEDQCPSLTSWPPHNIDLVSNKAMTAINMHGSIIHAILCR